MHTSVQSEILRMRLPSLLPPTPECIRGAEWLEVAAGLLPEAKTRELMKHAAHCGHCGPLLRNAADAIADDATPSEEALLSSLSSARPEWRKNMAATLRDSVRNGWQANLGCRTLFAWPTPAYAFVGVAAVAVVAWIGVRTMRPPSAEQLLAQAYTEHRTLEVRIPGAKYAPMRVERSGAGSSFDKPQSLLKAEALISESLQSHPNDSVWLGAKARAEMLDGSYDDAIKTLQRALESNPDSPELLTDLGSAYFLRAESADLPIDYGNSIDSFGRALSKNPDDPVALFNRALACEKLFLYTQAVDDWEHYLRIEPRSEWAEEARSRLAAVRDKARRRNQGRNEPLIAPSQFGEVSEGWLSSRLDPRLEEYMDLAVTEWLPEAFPAHADQRSISADEERALRVLSDRTTQRHGDLWFADLLAGRASNDFPAAVNELSEAIQANDRADAGSAETHAGRAAKLFTRSNNKAGVLRARIEVLAALNGNSDGIGCDRAMKSLGNILGQQAYFWLRARYKFESGTCAWLREDLGSARSKYSAAREEASTHGFRELYLRSLDRLAGLEAVSGSFGSAWKKVSQGLAAFWSGNYPDVRGYNFYFDIYELTRVNGLPHAQVAAWRDGIRLTESSPDIAQRAMAHLAMGNAAAKAGMSELSAAEFARADTLFSESPQIPSTRMAKLEAETRLAAVETSAGNFQQALARMKPLGPEIDALSNNYLGILFYSTLGEAESLGADSDQAENDLWKAVHLSQRQVNSLGDAKSRLQVVRESSTAYRALVQRDLLKRNPGEALRLWESYRAAPMVLGRQNSNRKEDSATPGLSENLAVFNNRTVVSYAILPKGLAIWVIDDRGIFSHWTDGGSAAVVAATARLRALCADPHSDLSDLQTKARFLYDALISPIRDRIAPDRALIAELDDDLEGLPLEALVDHEGRYLGATTTVSNSLGLNYRDESRINPPISRDTAALIVGVSAANPETGMSLPPLPDALAEADVVRSGFDHAAVLEAGLATRQSVLTHLPDARLFHFSGHAIKTSEQAGMVLSDALLTPSSIPKSSLSQLQLAVFSACETENGMGGATDEADSLVRVFLEAGVPDVVASRWRVDSAATRRFMELFYRALLDGNSVQVSIHRAQSDLRSEPNMWHPYYWSAFGAFGRS